MPPRLALLAVLVFVAALVGCGDSSPEQAPAPPAPVGAVARSCDGDVEGLRATGIPCDQARQLMYGWQRERSCSPPGGASRGSCLIRSYRCQAARTDRGLAVSCARAGESIAFVAKRR